MFLEMGLQVSVSDVGSVNKSGTYEHYVIKLVSDLRQVSDILRVFRFLL